MTYVYIYKKYSEMKEDSWDWLTNINSILEPYKQRILKDTIKNENTGVLWHCPDICEHLYLKNSQIKIDCCYFSGWIVLGYNK